MENEAVKVKFTFKVVASLALFLQGAIFFLRQLDVTLLLYTNPLPPSVYQQKRGGFFCSSFRVKGAVSS